MLDCQYRKVTGMVVHGPPNPTSESDFLKQSPQPISSSYGVFWQLKSHFSHGVYYLACQSSCIKLSGSGENSPKSEVVTLFMSPGLSWHGLKDEQFIPNRRPASQTGWMESGVWKNWAGRLLLAVIGLCCFDLKHSFWNVPVVNPITLWKCSTYLLEYPLTWMSCKMVVLGSVSYVYSETSCFVISSGLLAANTACCPPA